MRRLQLICLAALLLAGLAFAARRTVASAPNPQLLTRCTVGVGCPAPPAPTGCMATDAGFIDVWCLDGDGGVETGLLGHILASVGAGGSIGSARVLSHGVTGRTFDGGTGGPYLEGYSLGRMVDGGSVFVSFWARKDGFAGGYQAATSEWLSAVGMFPADGGTGRTLMSMTVYDAHQALNWNTTGAGGSVIGPAVVSAAWHHFGYWRSLGGPTYQYKFWFDGTLDKSGTTASIGSEYPLEPLYLWVGYGPAASSNSTFARLNIRSYCPPDNEVAQEFADWHP